MQGKRRGTQIDDDLGALLHQLAHRIDVVKRSRQVMFRPDVLTDRHADFFPLHFERLDAVGRLEITVLVENIVSRQK